MPPPATTTTNIDPPKQTPMPAQPLPNPNNKQHQPLQPMYLEKSNQYLTYALDIHNIHLRSRTTLPAPQPPVITEIPKPALERPTDLAKHNPILGIVSKEPILQYQVKLPYPQRLHITPSKSMEEPTFDILDQLKNMHIQVPIFQAIKDVPIYGKAINEVCLKKSGRKRKDPQTIHVLGQLANIMSGKIVIPKYTDFGSLLSSNIASNYIRKITLTKLLFRMFPCPRAWASDVLVLLCVRPPFRCLALTLAPFFPSLFSFFALAPSTL
jgi:hypothetical protein